MALEMKAGCERCHALLDAAAAEAWICSYECTFCGRCAITLAHRCPNCGGELLARPRRTPSGARREGAGVQPPGNDS
ncbi:MAG: DUF1272 domain-containing protein [Betaproteobacteria bacterium]